MSGKDGEGMAKLRDQGVVGESSPRLSLSIVYFQVVDEWEVCIDYDAARTRCNHVPGFCTVHADSWTGDRLWEVLCWKRCLGAVPVIDCERRW